MAITLAATGAGWLVAVGVGHAFKRPAAAAAHVAALTVAAAFCGATLLTAVLVGRQKLDDVRRFLTGLVVRLVLAALGLLTAATWFSGDSRDDLLLVGAGLYLAALAADTLLVYRATLRQPGDGSRT